MRKKNKKHANILIEDVRSLHEFFSLTSAESGWRVVLIDSVDEMSRSSANALLKILEEPPEKTLFTF